MLPTDENLESAVEQGDQLGELAGEKEAQAAVTSLQYSSGDAAGIDSTVHSGGFPNTLPPSQPVSLGPSSSTSEVAGIIRAMDQIRQRLKRRSVVEAQDPATDENAGAASTMTGFLRMRQTAREWRMKTWYCVLYKAHLYWYASKKDARVAKRLQGRVNVVGAEVSTGHGKIHVYPHAFVFTARNGQVYFCSAPTDTEQQQWIEEMNAASPKLCGNPDKMAAVQTRSSSSTSTASSSESGSNSTSSFAFFGSNRGTQQSFRRRSSTSFGSRLEVHTKHNNNNSKQSHDDMRTCCCTCELEFSALRRHRYVCGSCDQSFCRWHCSKDVNISGENGTRSARVCDSCAYRQYFITFAVALTSTMVEERKKTSCSGIMGIHDCFRHQRRHSSAAILQSVGDVEDAIKLIPQCHRREWNELKLIVSRPASFTALNLMCLMKKYLHTPWLFARTLCLFIPIFEVDPNGDLAEYWVQFIGMYVPLVKSVYPDVAFEAATGLIRTASAPEFNTDRGTFDEQQAALYLYIDVVVAICRRSPFFALRTVWECLALYDDARQKGNVVCANYILLLIYLVSSFHGDSELVASLWLQDAPEAQADAMVGAMDDLFRVMDLAGSEAPCTLAAQWIHAKRSVDICRLRQCVLESAASSNEPETTTLLEVLSPFPAEAKSLYEELVDTVTNNAAGVSEMDSVNQQSQRDPEQLFNDEANFVHNLTVIAERLRLVTPVAARKQALRGLLHELQDHLAAAGSSSYVYLPLDGVDAGSATQILRVVPDEGKVFSTRCRAPTMMVFEALVPESQRIVAPATGLTDQDNQDGKESEAKVPFLSQGSASRKRVPLHKLGRQDSQMLDQLLCSFEEASITSLVANAGADPSPESSSQSNSFEDESFQAELSIDEAQLIYGESTTASISGAAVQDNEDAEVTDVAVGQATRRPETWEEKTKRIQASSELGDRPGWTLVSVIAKSFDDLRQEVFALQLMTTLRSIFHGNDLGHLYLRPYRILCTGANVGLIETLTDALSIDAVKKQFGSLPQYFTALFGNESSIEYQEARQELIASMAASSVYCYLFQIKDRHNGNIMIDRMGHIIHIDFGFMLGIAPGGAFSLEKDCPFKLTTEMVELMGSNKSRGFKRFRELFLEGMLAVRREYIKLLSIIHLTITDSPFPCFQQQSPGVVLDGFRRRLFLEHSDEVATEMILGLVSKSHNNWGMRQYDKFQKSTNGILS
uniref:1-phosphatidylinositol 4-kinase n=1 Tax=Globisporangium ultimum (strain ATCC 200006 / CBS 805.95 / DAOM BR144) TaxID=431595 RepID=K3WKP1_GLOUD